MGGDKPHINGSDKAENGANGSDDVEMEEASIDPGKSAKGKGKETDEEMTVVVPPSKSSKLSDLSQKDGQGGVTMNGDGKIDVETAKEPEIDPRTTAISSKSPLEVS